MSYQQSLSINQFIPGYVVKSDYLPTRVVEGNQTQTSELVISFDNFSFVNMKSKKEKEECSRNAQQNSTPIDMLHTKYMKQFKLIDHLMKNTSAELFADDLHIHQSYQKYKS